jgi:hypothetical protein
MAKDKKNTSQKPQAKTPVIAKKHIQIKFKKVNLKEIKFKKPNLGKMKEDVSKFTKNPKTRPILKIVGLVLIIVGSFALIDFGVQYLNNDYSVAVVSGTRISKSSWNRLLQQAYGQTAAQQLIDNEVITQEAKKQNITASTSEIQTQIDQIVTSLGGQTQYQAALKSNNITEAELKDEIRIDVLTTKLISPTITYTDDDIKSFFTEYSAQLFPTETAALASGAELDYDTYKDQTIQYYIQQQVSNTKSTWLSSKEASYKIQDNATTTPTYGLFQTTINIVKNIVSDIKGSK